MVAQVFQCQQDGKIVILVPTKTDPPATTVYIGAGNYNASDASEYISFVMANGGYKTSIRQPIHEAAKMQKAKGLVRIL